MEITLTEEFSAIQKVLIHYSGLRKPKQEKSIKQLLTKQKPLPKKLISDSGQGCPRSDRRRP